MRLIFISWIYTMYLYFEHYFWKYDTSVSVYYLLLHTGKTNFFSIHQSWNLRMCRYWYNTVNQSEGSGITDKIQSTHQMEVEWHIWCSQHIRWKWNDRYDRVNISDGSGMTYDTVNISDGSGMTDMMQSAYQISYVIPLPSDMLSLSYLSFHFHLICWLHHICHSTSIWYVDCIISVIPLPSDMLTVSYVIPLPYDMLYQIEVEWQI
jgi:hypothetical protein